MEPLYTIVVRAGKDRDAVRAAISRFYAGWPVEVETLGGTRSPDAAEDIVKDLLSARPGALLIFLGGREDARIVERLSSIASERLAVVQVGKKRVRNARLEELHWYIERGRAKLRLRIGLEEGMSIHVHRASDSRIYPGLVADEPYADVFLATRGWRLWLERLGCRLTGGDIILERLAGGEHIVLDGGTVACHLSIPDHGHRPVAYHAARAERAARIDYDIARIVAEVYEAISLRLLREALQEAEEKLGGVDSIVVPWSGGKDSTIALYLAKRLFRDVQAVYVDTGVDFPHTREYVERMAERLGVELIVTQARVREELSSGREMPTHDNRWCTGLKLDALDSTLKRLGDRLVVVTGDRDAESEARSRRPPIRFEERNGVKKVVVSPLKAWSTILVQLYAQLRGVELNPLYEHGFYRLGCYICPALRSWEKMLLAKEPLVAARLIGLPFYRRSLSQG